MKIFKYTESNLVKLKEYEQNDTEEIISTDVEDFLNKKSKNFVLPNKLDRGDIYYALVPYRHNGGISCKPHPVMVIEDFGLNYNLFAKPKDDPKSQNKEVTSDSTSKEKQKPQTESQNKKSDSTSKEKQTPKEEVEYVPHQFNAFLPSTEAFYNSFSKGKEPMVLVYVLTTTLIDSLCKGLDSQYKPIVPTNKFPLPFFKQDNLKKFGYIELFKSIDLYNGTTKAFAPLLISKRTIFSNAGPYNSKARLQSTDRLLFSRMIINKDDWETEGLDNVLKGKIEPVGECLIEPMDFDNSGFRNDPKYEKETVTYVRNPLRIRKGEPEEVTVTIPIIKELQRSIIFAKYRKLMLEEKDLFPCWPDDLWGEIKEATKYDDYGNPDISSTNPIIEKSIYSRQIIFYKPSEEEFNAYKDAHFIPSNKKYEDITEKKVEIISDTSTLVNGEPKIEQIYVFSAERGRECRFEHAPEIIAWIPLEWEKEARKEYEEFIKEEMRRKEEERKRKEEEKESKKTEIKRDSNGKPIIKLRAQNSDKAQSSKKRIANVKINPSEKETPSLPINEEPKDTVVDTENEEINEVNESKEYSLSELKSFLESF